MIQLLAQFVSDEIVLDRLVPYLVTHYSISNYAILDINTTEINHFQVELLTDSQPRAKAAAVRVLTKCLTNIKYVPKR